MAGLYPTAEEARITWDITAAVDELTRDRSAMSLEAANREVYLVLKEGIRISVAERGSTPGHTSFGLRPPSPQRGECKGGQTTVRARVIDWEHPANNDCLLVSQFSVTGGWGMPNDELMMVELKAELFVLGFFRIMTVGGYK